MLRRLFLGHPRRDEKDAKKAICEGDKRIPNGLMKSSTVHKLEEKPKAEGDISDSDSETDGSETEDSDTETLDHSSRTDSYEDCSGDVLEWKGFEMVWNASLHESTTGGTQVRKGKILDREDQIGSSKGNEGHLGESGEVKKNKENPFAFDIRESKISEIHDEVDCHVNTKNNNSNTNNTESDIIPSNNSNDNINNNINNDINKSSSKSNNNDTSNNNNSNNNNNTNKDDDNINNNRNTNIQSNNTPTHKINSNNTAKTTNNITSTNNNVRNTKSDTKPTINTNNNTINNQKQINDSKQKPNKRQTKFDNHQSKTTLQFSKPSTTNHTLPNTKDNGISRHYSIRANQHTPNIKGTTSCRITTGEKPHVSTSIPGKGPKIRQAQNSMTRNRGASVDKKTQQSISKDTMGLKGGRIDVKGRQGNLNSSNVSVKDLEQILGVNVTELREVIKKFKSEKIGTTEDCGGQSGTVQSNLGSPEMTGDRMVGPEKSRDGCKNDEMKECKSETIDNKDEISSDSGVSEPDAHSTDGQPRYITLKTILKRKEYLEGQIKKLEDRVVVMEDHKKDIQFIHDLFDLHSDGLAKVERSNGGVACVANLKSILACQLREIEDDDFKAKLKGLEDLGIPNFSEINVRIEKLRTRIHHTLEDDRKCRSKGVQKLRFEIGKVQGMCEAVLDLVYTE